MMKNQRSSFFLGLLVSVIFLAGFFLGGLADRIFVIKPLSWLISKVPVLQKNRSLADQSITGSTSAAGQILASSDQVADIAQQAARSVVSVSIKKNQPIYELSQDIFSQFGWFGLSLPSVQKMETVQEDIGSGFVVAGNLVVTNKHVVADLAATYSIYDQQDREFQVNQIYRDPSLDLAILQVTDFSAPELIFGDSDQLRVGQSVIAIGTALGQFRHTVTTGVVSGLGRGITATDGRSGLEALDGVIQTDAAINPGNSGGPLIDSQGRVIGVNVATTTADNISFAIPINVVKAAIDNFNQTGQFDRPALGIKYQLISAKAALANEVPEGAYVLEVTADGNAARAGIEEGDIIIKFAGEKINEDQDLAKLINNRKIGEQVSVEIWRQESSQTLTVTLQK